MHVIDPPTKEQRSDFRPGSMKRIGRDLQAARWLVLLPLCVLVLTAIPGAPSASERTLRPWTETGGATPDPAIPPQPAVRKFNPKGTTVFTDRGAFLDSVSCRTISLESFEDQTPTNAIDASAIQMPDITITTDNPPRLGIWNQRFQGAFATDGVQWMGIEENQLVVPQVTTLAFDSPITHFGVSFTDYGDFGDGNLEFANDIGDQATAALSGEASGNLQFFGIINTARAFRIVTLTHEIAGEFFGVDEIYYCWRGAPEVTINRRSSGRVIPD
jgi:hypothetical protein